MAQAISTGTFTVSKFVVSATVTEGNYTTIQAAVTAASSGDTVYVRDGSYTENITLKAGVNISSLIGPELTPNVSIIGKLSFSSAGTVTISGIRLTTNTDFFLEVTGAAASIVNLENCYLNCLNNTGISFTSASASSQINIHHSLGNIGTTGISLFSQSSAGTLNISFGRFFNSGSSTTASTISAGVFFTTYSSYPIPITSSSTASAGLNTTLFSLTNTTALTIGGSGGGSIVNSTITSGNQSAISIGSSFTVLSCTIGSSNTNAITGAGSISYADLSFSSSSSNINTTTQTVLNSDPSANFGSSNSGNTNTLTVLNSSNTASSAANIVASVGGSTAADPTHQSVVSGVTTWTWGADNSVTTPTADPFVIAQGTALGTNNVMSVATSGEINYPLQPAFLAYVNTTITNVTGDTSIYTIIYDTEVFDQNGDFNLATSTFTAPVTGLYEFHFMLMVSGGTTISVANATIATSNRTYNNTMPFALGLNTIVTRLMSVITDMDAADTTVFQVVTTDSGGKIDDINGLSGSSPRNYVSGKLSC